MSSTSSSSRRKSSKNALQKEERRRKLRKDYQKLYAETLDSHRDIVKRDGAGNKQLKELLQRGNQLHQSVVHAREGALDSKWFTTTAKYGAESVQRIEETQVWDIEELTAGVKNHYRGTSEDDPVDWTKLGKAAAKYFRRAPELSFMNGPIALNVKKRKKPVRRAKKLETGKSTRPEEVELEKEKENQEESTRYVRKLHKKLHKTYQHEKRSNPDVPGVSYWRLVLDPNSFTRTIENIFYYSFLVKDSRSGLLLTEDNELIAAPLAQTDAEGQERHQSIMRLDYNTYLRLCEKHKDLFEPGVNLATQSMPPTQPQGITASQFVRHQKRARENDSDEEEGSPVRKKRRT